MKNTLFNILDVLRTKVRVVKNMVPLSEKTLRSISFIHALRLIVYLSMGRTSRLAFRAKCVYQFLDFVLALNKQHGSTFTIKWLKAGYVAIQKELGQDRLKSLRVLDPEIPLPRLNGGLPRGIPVCDRVEIRKGNVAVIRFWSSLFNLYRVLLADPKLKLETITNPLSVPESNITGFIDICKSSGFNFFERLPGSRSWFQKDLSPVKLELSKSASPSNKVSAFGVLTDIYNLVTSRLDLWEALHHFAYASSPTQTPFMEFLAEGYDIITELASHTKVVGTSGTTYTQMDAFMVKPAIRAHGAPTGTHALSQFAIKEEAAGKIRLFALMDSITQTFMRPLHDALFDVLRAMPNDGTFDQEASIRRSQSKAKAAGMAYSFDLTAATDRLPAALSAEIISVIFGHPYLGKYWLKIMTDRDFGFNEAVAVKLKVSEGPYRYAVGQPMGGLSSWPALAVTHHWIVQLAASRALGTRIWFSNYEVLGDDIVIFDKDVADQYLVIMSEIGCEINLTKSIVSHNRPVFEFAKRTCWGDNIVSGISIAQLRAGAMSTGARVGNALALSALGFLSDSNSVLLAVLSKYASRSILGLKDQSMQLGLLATLGSLYQQGKVSLEELVTAVINPMMGLDMADQAVGLPAQAVLNVVNERLHGVPSKTEGKLPWSRPDERADFFAEHQEFFVVKTLSDNVALCQDLMSSWKEKVFRGSLELFFPLVPDHINYEMVSVKTKNTKAIKLALAKFPKSQYNVVIQSSGNETVITAYPLSEVMYLDLKTYLGDLPSQYVNEVHRVTEWWGQALGLGFATDDPAELLEEAMDMLEQFQYDSMLTLEEALKFQDRITNFDQSINFREEKVRDDIIEGTPILSYIRVLVGKTPFKRTGFIGM